MQVRLSGAMSVRAGETTIDGSRFPGRQARLVFAYLVSERSRPVPRDELADLLWGDELPPTWQKSLGMIVSRLRNLIGEPGGAITSAFGCYQLRLPEDVWVDAEEAARAADDAKAALESDDAPRAADLAAEVATFARTPFLPGEEGAWVESKRQELRGMLVRALDIRTEASLAAGDAEGARLAAEEAVGVEPFRESGYSLLMRAHAAGGNRAEALRVFEQCRTLLADELGVDPSAETMALFTSLLRGEGTRTARDARSVPAPAGRRRPLRTSMVGLVAAGVAAAALVATGVVYAVSPKGLPAVGVNDVGLIDARSGRIAHSVPLASSHGGIAASGDAVWVTSNDGTIQRIDARTAEVVQTISTVSPAGGIAIDAGAVWATIADSGVVVRIDPRTNRIVQTVATGNGPRAITADGAAIWVANELDGTVSRVDAASGALTGTVAAGGTITALAVAEHSLWITDRSTGSILRVSLPSMRVIQRVNVGNGPAALAAAGDSVWAANQLDGTVTDIDASSGAVVATLHVGSDPASIAYGEGRVWVADGLDGAVSEIDASSARVIRTVRVGSEADVVAVAGSAVWVGAGAPPNGHRGGTLVVGIPEMQPVIDPALANETASYEIASIQFDGLVGYARREGPAGTEIVPDLAASLPHVSDDGRTYTFRLRPGIRYSDGSSVRAGDFRFAIERLFRIGSQASSYFADVVGADTCSPKACDLTRGIAIDDAAGSVTFRLTAPDPELLPKLTQSVAAAVPPGTPLHDVGLHPIPATGPYVVTAVGPDRLQLSRNPYFHEWSALAQPDGRPDTIVYRLGMSGAAQFAAVKGGTVDITTEFLSEAELQEAVTRYASQAHPYAVPGTFAFFLDTRRPPFDDARARAALAYAIDRDRIAQLLGGGLAAAPTCQMLPPGFPGYRPYCPFTAEPDASSRWRAPDLARARSLVAASGTRGTRVRFAERPDFHEIASYVASVLRSLGYDAEVSQTLTHDQYLTRETDPVTADQLTMFYWFPDFVAPSEFIAALFTCRQARLGVNGTNLSHFCDAALDRDIGAAEASGATDPTGALGAWTALDRRVTDLAPAVAAVTPRGLDFTSPRVGNYLMSGAGLRLIDELWVR